MAAPLTSVAEAAELIESTYSQHGSGVLSCRCGDWETWIDGSSSLMPLVVSQVAGLYYHSRIYHQVPHAIIFTKTIVVVDPDVAPEED